VSKRNLKNIYKKKQAGNNYHIFWNV